MAYRKKTNQCLFRNRATRRKLTMFHVTTYLLLLTCSRSVLGERYILPLFGLNNTEDSANTKYKLIITSSVSSSVTVEGTSGNFSSTNTISVGSRKRVPVSGVTFPNASMIGNESLVVESTDNVTLQVLTWHTDYKEDVYKEGFMAIPVSGLGNEYYVSTFCALGGFCQIAIATTVSGKTELYLRLPNNTYEEIAYCMPTNMWKSGRDSVISLDYPETLQITSARDLTGSYIYSDNPVSVLVGAHSIPDGSTGVYHYIEQLSPTSEWGTEFMMTSHSGSSTYGDVIIITARQDDTTVSISGLQDTTLAAGQYINRRFEPNAIIHITSSHPVQVMQITGIEFETISSTTSTLTMRNPAMSLVPALEHMTSTSIVGCANSAGTKPSIQIATLTTTPPVIHPLSTQYTYHVPYTQYNIQGVTSSNSSASVYLYDSVGTVWCEATALMPTVKPVIPIPEPCTMDPDRMFPGDGIDGDCGGIIDDDHCFENKKINATFITDDGQYEPHFEDISGFRYLRLRVNSLCDTPNIYLTTENHGTIFIQITTGEIVVHDILSDNNTIDYHQNMTQYDLDCGRIYPFWLLQDRDKICFDFGPVPPMDCTGTYLTINTTEVVVGMRIGGTYTNVTFWIDMMQYDCDKLHSAWRCDDFITNCEEYGSDACNSHPDWAEAYCALYCGHCLPDSYGQLFILTLPSTNNNNSIKVISVFSKNPSQNSTLPLIGIGLMTKNYQSSTVNHMQSYMQSQTNDTLPFQAFYIHGETETDSVIHIYAEEDVRVTVNYHMQGYDFPNLIYAVEPVDASGTEYMTSFIHSEITCHILSHDGETHVWKQTRDVATDLGIVTANETMIISLNDSETTGTIFTSSKPFTVFCGNKDANFTWQQLRPTSTWGRTYMVPAVYDQNVGNLTIRVVTNSDNTLVSVNGNFDLEFLLASRGDHYDQAVEKEHVYNITANHPISVSVLYKNSVTGLVDSGWVTIPPTLNFINNTELFVPAPEYMYASVFISGISDNGTSSDDSFDVFGFTTTDGVYHASDIPHALLAGRTVYDEPSYILSTSNFMNTKQAYSCHLAADHKVEDGYDNDCDGLVDEETICYTGYGAQQLDHDLDGGFYDDCLNEEIGTPVLALPDYPLCVVNVSKHGCWMMCESCKCSWVTNLNNYNQMTEQQQIAYNENITEIYIKLLTVNKETLSSEKAKFESAEDARQSSQSIGYVGYIIFTLVIFLFVLFDMLKFVPLLKNLYRIYRSS